MSIHKTRMTWTYKCSSHFKEKQAFWQLHWNLAPCRSFGTQVTTTGAANIPLAEFWKVNVEKVGYDSLQRCFCQSLCKSRTNVYNPDIFHLLYFIGLANAPGHSSFVLHDLIA